jgi:hypothetical protein
VALAEMTDGGLRLLSRRSFGTSTYSLDMPIIVEGGKLAFGGTQDFARTVSETLFREI